MDLLNQRVKHATLGTGTIMEQTDCSVLVQFPAKTSKFIYPDAFTGFLTVEDNTVHALLLKEMMDARAAALEKTLTEETARRADRDTKTTAAKLVAHKRLVHSPVKTTKPQREAGKPMVFFVFQGSAFDTEHSGSYIWAPLTNKAGSNVHHWKRLLDVQAGDIIFHGCYGHIVAISTARAACYNCPEPGELGGTEQQKRDGRRIDCDYIIVQHPLKTVAYKDDMARFPSAKYSPFNKDGNGNVGYLYELNRELARIFVSDSVKANPYLLDYDVIKDFLDETNT